MKFVFIRAKSAEFPVAVLCAVLSVSRSGSTHGSCVQRPARVVSGHDQWPRFADLPTLPRNVCGSPASMPSCKATRIHVGRKRVERLMREGRLQARRKRRFCKTTDSKHPFPIAQNVLNPGFDVNEPNSVWGTDVTFISTAQGWVYLAVMLDLFSRRVVGWAVVDPTTRRLLFSLTSTFPQFTKAEGEGLVHHSDRGSPYASQKYREALKTHGMVPSMSRSGDCWDNAVAESFFCLASSRMGRPPAVRDAG